MATHTEQDVLDGVLEAMLDVADSTPEGQARLAALADMAGNANELPEALDEDETKPMAKKSAAALLRRMKVRSKANRRCLEGPNAGKPGVCPESYAENGGDDETPDSSAPLATDSEVSARTRRVSPSQITTVNLVGHTSASERHVEEIAASMREDGWKGAPLLVVRDSENNWQALTGSHRLEAARRAELDEIPVVWISKDDVLEAAGKAGYDLPSDADFTDLEDEDRLRILASGGDKVAAEIMRREVEKESES